jgi:hypothetical protein
VRTWPGSACWPTFIYDHPYYVYSGAFTDVYVVHVAILTASVFALALALIDLDLDLAASSGKQADPARTR